MAALQDSDPRHVGAYRLLERLAVGGMGIVYLGESPSGRKVAVKLIRPEQAGDPEFRARFRTEVAACRLPVQAGRRLGVVGRVRGDHGSLTQIKNVIRTNRGRLRNISH